MTGDKISVVIPTYNREKLVSNAINSVLQQTLPVSEIIVVDDGSVDGTKEVLSDFGDKIVYIYQENGGIAAARNTGIRAATGDWIAFLDSDDIWVEEKIQKQVDALTSSGADVCCSGHKTNLNDKYYTLAPDLLLGEHHYYSDALNFIFRQSNHPFVQSMLIKKSLIIRLGFFDETLAYAEDTKLVFGIPFLTGISYINEPLFILNRTKAMERSIDNKNVDILLARFESHIRIASDVSMRLIPRNEELAKRFQSKVARNLCRASEIYVVKKNRDLSRFYAVKALRQTSSIKVIIRCIILLTMPWVLNKYLERKFKIKMSK